MSDWTPEIAKALAAPFNENDVSWVVVATKGKNTPEMMELWAPYIEADPIMERLDAVVGPGGWSMDIEGVGSREAICRLTVLGVMKAGVGQVASDAQTDQPFKAAATDALKRAAVLFAIGRYLHRVDKDWRKPTAGGSRPKRGAAPKPATAPPRPVPIPEPPPPVGTAPKAPPPSPRPSPGPATQAAKPEAPKPPEPATGKGQPLPPGQQSFQDVMTAHDLDLAGACQLLRLWSAEGDKVALSAYVTEIMARKGCEKDAAWTAASDALSEAVAKRDLAT